LLQAEDDAVGFDRFERRFFAADELPEIPPGLEMGQRDAHFLEGVLLAELERVDPEAEGEERIVELADADRRARRFREPALEEVPDEGLVEDKKERRGDKDEDRESGGDGPDAEDLPERLLHGRPVRIISSIEPAGGRREAAKRGSNLRRGAESSERPSEVRRSGSEERFWDISEWCS
jgi:hypothetical protein